MKRNLQLFLKSFVISVLIFSLLSTIIITAAYSSLVSVDPKAKASNLMFVVTNTQDTVVSISVLHIDPQNRSISFAPIPDNTVLGEGALLQSLYKKGNVTNLKKEVENLMGVKISRYIVFVPDKIERMVNQTGSFEHTLSYPFMYGGSTYAGTVLLDGALTRQMFLYGNYDLTSVSYAEIGVSFLQGFLSKYGNEASSDKLVRAICENGFCNSRYTDLSEKEVGEYMQVLSQYHSLTFRRVNIEGEYNITSARIYFVPESTKADKNIFE